MKIYKKHGTKGKLFEMMERVNKIKLNEGTLVHTMFQQIVNDLPRYETRQNHDGSESLTNGQYELIFDNRGQLITLRGGGQDQPVEMLEPEFVDQVNQFKQGGGMFGESFDNPVEKDESYLSKGGDEAALAMQPNKYDDGTRQPRNKDVQVKNEPSLEKMKGDDEPIKEGWFKDSFNDMFPDTTSHRKQGMRGAPSGVASVQHQRINKANEIKEKYMNTKRSVGINQLAKSLANDYKKLTGYDIESQHTLDPQIADGYVAEADGDPCPHCGGSGKQGQPTDGVMSIGGVGESEEEIDIDAVAIDDQPADGDVGVEVVDIENNGEEAIEGGLGDGASPADFDPKQILMGMEVEMEHTHTPHEALEIAMDHLKEDPQYYGNGDEDPDLKAQDNAQDDASEIEDEVIGTESGEDDNGAGEEAPEKMEDDDLSVNMNWLETIKPKKVDDMEI